MLILGRANDTHSAKEISQRLWFSFPLRYDSNLSLISNCWNMSHLVGGKLFWPYQIIFKHAVSFVVTKTLQPQISKGRVTKGKKKIVIITEICNKTANADATDFTVTWLTVRLFRSERLPKMRKSNRFPQIILWQTASQCSPHTYSISKAKRKLPGSNWSPMYDLQCWEFTFSPFHPFFTEDILNL